MAEKKFKIAAGPKLPAGAFVNLFAAGVMSRGAKAGDPIEHHVRIPVEVGGKLVDTIEADIIEHPDRLEHAVKCGHLSITQAKG